jgi:hypothetical protein
MEQVIIEIVISKKNEQLSKFSLLSKNVYLKKEEEAYNER